MNVAAMVLVAALIDCALGWPDALYRRIGHPVTWMGRLIELGEAKLNRGSSEERFWAGCRLIFLTGGAVLVPTLFINSFLSDGFWGVIIGGVMIWPFIAIRSMHQHVSDVAEPLLSGDLAAARRAVSMIVGRDPSTLDQAGVSRATIESLAENTSDGIIAPIFWGVIGGLPGIALYKLVNTLDSMIGHRNERYADFGMVAAVLDDVVNWIPARLSGVIFALSDPERFRLALSIMRRDAPAHRSPNAGWPEAAMAGVLGVRLSGPRIYGDRIADEPWLNARARDPEPVDVSRALALYRRAIAILLLALAALALL